MKHIDYSCIICNTALNSLDNCIEHIFKEHGNDDHAYTLADISDYIAVSVDIINTELEAADYFP